MHKFLLAPGAALALQRNLRRDHIDEEMSWIRAALASEPHKLRAKEAEAVESQWRFYVAEQKQQQQQQQPPLPPPPPPPQLLRLLLPPLLLPSLLLPTARADAWFCARAPARS